MSTDSSHEHPVLPHVAPEDAAAHALFAAIAQIGLALRESQEPVSQLGSLFATLSETLGALRSAPFTQNEENSVALASARGLLEQLQSDVFKGVTQLQFYDRMVQHMSHLQEYLISVANELGPLRTRTAKQDTWDEMHSKLRRRLISDEQRGLLDLFLSPESTTRVSAQAVRVDHSPPGSEELF